MEKSAKNKTVLKESVVVDIATKIKSAYKTYVLEHGKQPASVFQFSKINGMTEDVFYQHYNSFGALEKVLWKEFMDETLSKLHGDAVYRQYTVREKLLSFYYTWIEVLKTNRSFVLYTLNLINPKEGSPEVLKLFKREFLIYVNELLIEGKETEEIMNRPLISSKYDDGLWLQLLFVLRFWHKDESQGFEKTDAAIEKAVNLSFDLMGRSPLDTMFDFAKFVYQNK